MPNNRDFITNVREYFSWKTKIGNYFRRYKMESLGVFDILLIRVGSTNLRLLTINLNVYKQAYRISNRFVINIPIYIKRLSILMKSEIIMSPEIAREIN